MAKYQTTFGRPRNFKIGSIDIKIGKHPVEIPDEFARKILKDYPGWIVQVSGSKLPEEENAEPEPEVIETPEEGKVETGPEVIEIVDQLPEESKVETGPEKVETETDELEIIPSDADIITENAYSVTENAEPATEKAPKKTTKKADKK